MTRLLVLFLALFSVIGNGRWVDGVRALRRSILDDSIPIASSKPPIFTVPSKEGANSISVDWFGNSEHRLRCSIFINRSFRFCANEPERDDSSWSVKFIHATERAPKSILDRADDCSVLIREQWEHRQHSHSVYHASARARRQVATDERNQREAPNKKEEESVS